MHHHLLIEMLEIEMCPVPVDLKKMEHSSQNPCIHHQLVHQHQDLHLYVHGVNLLQ